MLRKQFNITVKEMRKNGGRILINTAVVDRDKDRVLPQGALTENYMKNPVVQWGHNYREPWATIGKTTQLVITPEGIIADFELRPAANEQDPQNVVLLLWNGSWINAASIGFDPRPSPDMPPQEGDTEARAYAENDFGGRDYTRWELLEWSLVPIPANQEALRLAVKALSDIKEKDVDGDVAWIRRLIVESDVGEQTTFACFHAYSVYIPEGATKLTVSPEGEITIIPHPDAGTSVARKEVMFVPPVRYFSQVWGDDTVYSIGGPSQTDEKLLEQDDWKVKDLSDVLLSLPQSKALSIMRRMELDFCRLTSSGVNAVKRMLTSKDIVIRPYPNEHACRLRNPDDFQAGSWARISREHEGKEYGIIIGRLTGEETTTEQSYRYNKDVWEVSEARSYCGDHDGQLFEPATESVSEPDQEPQVTEELDAPEHNEEWLDALAAFVDVIEDSLSRLK